MIWFLILQPFHMNEQKNQKQKPLSSLRSQQQMGPELEQIPSFPRLLLSTSFFLTWTHLIVASAICPLAQGLWETLFGAVDIEGGAFLLSNLLSQTFHQWNAGEAFCG